MNAYHKNNINSTKTTLCQVCNSNIPLEEYFKHKERCDFFRQTFKNTQGSISSLKASNKFSDNRVDAIDMNNIKNSDNQNNPFIKIDSNSGTLGSFKTSKRDLRDKEREDKERDKGKKKKLQTLIILILMRLQ